LLNGDAKTWSKIELISVASSGLGPVRVDAEFTLLSPYLARALSSLVRGGAVEVLVSLKVSALVLTGSIVRKSTPKFSLARLYISFF
jgi:hypothetical protein